jgi:hypothetical protein
VAFNPKTPFQKAGSLIEQPRSVPSPIKEAPDPTNAPLNGSLFEYYFLILFFYLLLHNIKKTTEDIAIQSIFITTSHLSMVLYSLLFIIINKIYLKDDIIIDIYQPKPKKRERRMKKNLM